MTRDDAVKWLENLNNDIGKMQFRALWDYAQAIDEIIKLLQAETEWIPLSERLPKVGEQVLCCDSQSRVFTSALTEIASNGMVFFGQHCKVIAWMPLPKPYREESEVEE